MLVQKIPVLSIVIPDIRVTAVYDEELTQLLRSTMQAAGMIQPIIVVRVGDKYHLVDGKHRLDETIAAGKSEIDAAVFEGEEKDALLLNLITNHTRGKTRVSELMRVLQALYVDYKMPIEEIQRATGFTQDYVERLIKISETHALVRDLLDREIIGVGVAFEISRLPSLLQQEAVAAEANIYRYTVKDMRERVNRVLQEMEVLRNAPPKQQQRTAPQPVCDGCQQPLDSRYARPIMVCPTCFGQLWRLHKQEAELQQVVAKPNEDKPVTVP